MSGIISDSSLLELEEDRVVGRTNLRKQGIVCSDDIGISDEMEKIDDIQSWVKYLNKTLSGHLYDETLTTMPDLSNLTQLTGVELGKVTNIPGNKMAGTTTDRVIFRNATTVGYNPFNPSDVNKIVVLSRFNGTVADRVLGGYTSRTLVDAGFIGSIVSGANLNTTGTLKYVMLRKADGIATLDNTSRLGSSQPLVFVPQAQISNYENGTNWSATNCTFLALEGSRFEDLDWTLDWHSKCTLDGNTIEVLDTETVAIFKHTENISHCYENGVELQDTDIVKGKTLTSTI